MKKIIKLILIFTMLYTSINFITKPVSADWCDKAKDDPLPNWCED